MAKKKNVERTQYQFASHESEPERGSSSCGQAISTDSVWNRDDLSPLSLDHIADSLAKCMMLFKAFKFWEILMQ